MRTLLGSLARRAVLQNHSGNRSWIRSCRGWEGPGMVPGTVLGAMPD